MQSKEILNYVPAIGYSILLLLFMIFYLVAKWKESIQDRPKGLQEKMHLMATFLYHFMKKKNWLISSGKVRTDLMAVVPQKKIGEAEEEYYTQKFSFILMLVLIGLILALALSVASVNERVMEGNKIPRKSYGEGDFETALKAEGAGGEALGKYEVQVGERLYTKDEADELFQKAKKKLPKVIRGENKSIKCIKNKLNLCSKLEGYPFTIHWDSSNYSLMDTDGTPGQQNLRESGEEVKLTALYTYATWKWEQVITVRVMPKDRTPEETKRQQMEEALRKANERSAFDSEMTLPGEVQGKKLSFREMPEDFSPYFFLISAILAGLFYFLKDKELNKQVEQRDQMLLLGYAQFVSKLTLFLSAGLTIRGAFHRMEFDYRKKRNHGSPESPLYEEVSRVQRELDGGVFEAEAYEHFGRRCRRQEYTRLITLLIQNLRKGSNELLLQLKRESGVAASERMDQARIRGEQASTKLMLPMMLMLFVVMLLVMVPAYLSF